jgi:LysR family transcriptional regulator, nod-box dependent transcriptional activator
MDIVDAAYPRHRYIVMNLGGLDLNLLVVLDALLTEESVSRAGHRVGLSQSATSAALGRLRRFFSDELLVPVGRKMILTPRAHELTDPVRELILRAEDVIRRSSGFQPSTSSRRFRLMMSDYVSTVLMPSVLSRAGKEAPSIAFELLSLNDPITAVERGDVDLLIMPQQFLSAVHPSESLFADRWFCVAWSGAKEMASGISRERYFAAGHVGVRREGLATGILDEWMGDEIGHKRRVEVVATSFNLAVELVVGTTRIATVPERLARKCADGLPLRCFRPPIRTPRVVESMQWHRVNDSDPALAWLRGVLKQAASKALNVDGAREVAGPDKRGAQNRSRKRVRR